MKAVAGSNIGQYEAAVRGLADYERSVKLGLSVCFRRGGLFSARSGRKRAGRTVGIIVFGSDQGLVGPFNEVITAFLEKTLAALRAKRKSGWSANAFMRA